MTAPVILALVPGQGNARVLTEILARAGYRTLIAHDAPEMYAILAGENAIDVALIDAVGSRRDVWAACESVRARGIPFLLIGPRPDPVFQREALARGASAVLTKPLQPTMLKGLLDSLTAPSVEAGA